MMKDLVINYEETAMGHLEEEKNWTSILLITDHNDRFIVVSNGKEGWELPFDDNKNGRLKPIHEAAWLGCWRLGIELIPDDLELVYESRDDAGYPVHLFENITLKPRIKNMFDYESPYIGIGSYKTMTFHQASLKDSGLDNFHRLLLAGKAKSLEEGNPISDKPRLFLVHSADPSPKIIPFSRKPK